MRGPAMSSPPTPDSAVADPSRISLSLSGGGYRAAAFALGSMLCLADLGLHGGLAVVSSVSGGSITNAFAASHLFVRDRADHDHWDRSGRLLEMFATWSLAVPRLVMFEIGLCILAAVVVIVTVTLAIYDRVDPTALIVELAVCLPPFGAAVYVSLSARASQRLHRFVRDGSTNGADVRPANLVKCAVYLYTFRWRKFLRLRSRMFPAQSIDTLTMSALRSTYCPVFCTTDLASGGHFYIADRFVAGVGPTPRRVDADSESVNLVGSADSFPVTSAVMASAAFPGAFQPVKVDTARFGLPQRRGLVPDRVRLADGGLYDNLGFTFPKAWAEGNLDDTISRQLGKPPTFFVVVDSGLPRFAWARRMGPVRSFLRSIDVIHQANSRARREQVASFLERKGRRGFVVSIGDHPYEVAESRPDSGRSKELVEALDRMMQDEPKMTRAWWRSLCDQWNPDVRTKLKRLGAQTTAELVLHGYMATLAHAALAFDLAVPPQLPSLSSIESRCGKAPRWS